MHNCGKTREQLIDLVFDELEGEPKQRLLAELKDCPACRDYHQSLTATLVVFDQAAEAALPGESYWPGYEARLRARLAEASPSNPWRRLLESVTGFKLWPGVPLAAAVGLILLALALGIWLGRRQGDGLFVKNPIATSALPGAQASPSPTPPSAAAPGTDRPKPKLAPPPRRFHPRLPRVPEGRRKGPVENAVVAEADPSLAPAARLDPARHFERAQLVLRAFRNADFSERQPTFDLAYERPRVKQLLSENILLRRAAEAKGNLPVEEVLNRLEPLLLDIANLPDKPAPGDVLPVKERIGKQEIIAVLQVYSMSTALASNQPD